MVFKGQQMVLHVNLQIKGSSHIYHFIWGNHIQQLTILKVIIIETRCLQI